MGSVTPSGGGVTINSDNTVTLSWNIVAAAHTYDVQVFAGTGVPIAGQECRGGNRCVTDLYGTSYTFAIESSYPQFQNATAFTWRIRAKNPTCVSRPNTGAWKTQTFSVVRNLNGTVYLDDEHNATKNLEGKCELSSPVAQDISGSQVQVSYGANTFRYGITGSSYSATVPNIPSLNITLLPQSQWRCTCPADCTYAGSSRYLSTGMPFFVSPAARSWWQTQGGLVYAGGSNGNAVVSQIPSSAPSNSVLSQPQTTSPHTSGIVITGGGDIDTTVEGATRYGKLRATASQERIIGSSYNGPKENYQYFYNLYSMGATPTTDFSGGKPSVSSTNGRAYYAGGDVSIATPWVVADGEEYVVFINGNLRVRDQIRVAHGGFVAFIVSGDVIFENTLGVSVPTSSPTPVIEGVFIANRIIVEGNRTGGDLQFSAAGTFVGWDSVVLQRRFSILSDNDLYPTEFFAHRPDFVMQTPDRMRRPSMIWQESN